MSGSWTSERIVGTFLGVLFVFFYPQPLCGDLGTLTLGREFSLRWMEQAFPI